MCELDGKSGCACVSVESIQQLLHTLIVPYLWEAREEVQEALGGQEPTAPLRKAT